MQLKNIISRQILSDKEAISSTIDVMFFLLMVSLSAVVLMPVLLSSGHNAAVQDVAAYRFDEQLLRSLLDSRVEGFEYMVVPSSMSCIVDILPENSMSICQSNDLFAKEHASRTFADLISEGMLFSLRTEENGTYCYLHPFSSGYSEATERIVEEYLDRRIGGRYNYRLEANWQPVPGCGPSGQLVVGAIPPDISFRQSALISVPYNYAVSLADISSPAGDLKFGRAVNSSQKEQELCSMFNECISQAASGSSASIVGIYYPEEYLERISSGQANMAAMGDSLMGSPFCEGNIERTIAIGILGNAVKVTDNMCSYSTDNVTNLTEDNISLVGNQLRQEHTNDVYTYLSGAMSEEINSTVQAMMQTNDSITLLKLRDRQIRYILMHARPPAAEVTLVVW
ncbi:hypothetical protein [Methanomethylovorans sp.]|uniref:DUF7284 family protein n=1 Tax=Methanomethylovorans sp. TaxID=2758717 RepID=UPI00351C1EF9